jgi:hypothetical protein
MIFATQDSAHKRRLNARPFDGRMVFVPEGQTDRSQARSPWVTMQSAPRPGCLFSVLSQSFSLLSFVPDHTVPYGTALSREAFPGTSCQATIGVVPPGRTGRHFATA